jgi:uncharacterized protein (TIGR02118 family)
MVFCASVTYPVDTGRFDLEYFATRHAPMFAELLGENCLRWEVHRPVAAPGAPPPPFLAAAYFWVSSGADFGRVLAEQGTAIYADIGQFSDAQPIRGWSEVL